MTTIVPKQRSLLSRVQRRITTTLHSRYHEPQDPLLGQHIGITCIATDGGVPGISCPIGAGSRRSYSHMCHLIGSVKGRAFAFPFQIEELSTRE